MYKGKGMGWYNHELLNDCPGCAESADVRLKRKPGLTNTAVGTINGDTVSNL